MNLETLDIGTIEALLDTLTVDVSFVDANDRLVYFNSPKGGRIFPRTKIDIGRKVQNCHPPQSLHKVNAILEGFRSGSRDNASFWIDLHDKFVTIDYFPVQAPDGRYLGTLEVTQDTTRARSLEGERRILDD